MSKNLEVALTLKARDEMSRPVSRAMQELAKQSKTAEQAVGGVGKASKALSDAAQAPKAASRGMNELAREAQAAGKAVIGLTQESKRLADARGQLGVRSEQTIQREIRLTEAAYKRLANSGTLSAKEQSRAYEAMRQRVAELRRELAGVSQLQRGMVAGAKGLAAGAAGVAAGAYVLGQPVKRTMDYDHRLAMMANTAFAERNVAGRRSGMHDLDEAIKHAVRVGGGSREGAAETLDNLLASGSMSQKTAVNLLPTLQKYSTATGADPNELGNIAVRATQTFKIKENELPMVLDMAIKAGQEGGFELKDMSKWLPQQMAAAKQSGMSGMEGMAKLLAVNQAAVITAGTKDEAGNNVVNLLAKINSQDTAKDAAKLSATTFQEKKKGEKGIDLAGTLAAAREKGVDSLDAFVGLVDKVVAHDKRYQDIQSKLKTAKGDDRKALLESQGDILQGSAVGKLIQDRQALMALVGYMGNRGYVKDIEAKLPGARGTGQTNFELIEGTASYQTERAKNEKTFAEQKAFDGLSSTIGDVAGKLADYAQSYPGLAAAVVGTTATVTALGAAAGAAAIPMLLMGGGSGAGGGLLWRALGGLPVLLRAGGGVALAGAAGYGVGTAINAVITKLLTATNGGKERTLGTWLYDLTHGDQDARILAPTPLAKHNDPNAVTPIPQLAQRNAPSTAAPIPQLDLLQSAVSASTKLDLAAQKMQQAVSQPIPIQVTVDVKNGNIVAAVNAANSTMARRN